MIANMKLNKVINPKSFSKYFVPSSQDMPARRNDLDWLRIIVFGLLILFHTGMFYTANWGFHAKSAYQSETLENFMLIIEPWRMAVLWVISGIAIKFVLAKVSLLRFISMRSLRLLLPLLFGILVIVPPQLYVEMIHNGDLQMNFWQFLLEFFSTDSDVFEKYQSGIWPHIDVNHLWFIRALWQYSIGLIFFLPLLNSLFLNKAVNWLCKQHGVVAILIAVLPIFLITLNWDQDTVRYPLGFTFIIYGYLIGWHVTFWQRISQAIKPLLIAAVICCISFVTFYNLVWLDLIKGGEVTNQWLLMAGMFNYSLMRILGILTVFALAHKFLNRDSTKLTYFNDAVYPFYILHQTFILVIGYNLSSLNLGPVLEPLLLIICTVAACFIGFEVIRRTELLRPCFGLKMTKKYSPMVVRLGYISAYLMILPIGYIIFSWSVYLIATSLVSIL
ncbi:MAG: hypothetical protein ACI9LM_003658 [Alteromonadaceae bacterium]|jgi:hypothetical protein